MKQRNINGAAEELPRHMCSVIVGGPCDVPGQPRHDLQLHSEDDFAVLAAQLLNRALGASLSVQILDVDTLLCRAEPIDAEEAHRRFAPACLKADPPEPPFGGLSKGNSRDS